MADPRTIDNLGPDASSRYAQDRKLYDESIFKDQKQISNQTEIMVTSPSISEVDSLFETQRRNIYWADFSPPPKELEKARQIFTHQILPSLGSEDRLESQIQRISATVKPFASETENKNLKMSWENERETLLEEKEKKTLTGLFSTIHQLDKDLVDINSRRSEYQKG